MISVPTIENRENLCIWMCFSFFSQKIRYHNQVIRKKKHFKILKTFLSVPRNRFEIFDFSFNFDQKKQPNKVMVTS